MVTIQQSFLVFANAVTTVNNRWPAVIFLSAGSDRKKFIIFSSTILYLKFLIYDDGRVYGEIGYGDPLLCLLYL